MKKALVLLIVVAVSSCAAPEKETSSDVVTAEVQQKLDLVGAERIVQLPLQCIDTEYPNKLGQTLAGDEDLKSPDELHPAFYGCFDWHSAVHGHWSLVRLAKAYPDLKDHNKIMTGLSQHITKENIEGEIKYFDHEYNKSFERMYGWAWLYKLAEELHSWDDPRAKELEQNLQPLMDLIVEKTKEFLPKLHYPIRVGTHTNTAFAMTMIYDYAEAVGDQELKEVVTKRAKHFFLKDKDCPLSWEPSGYDFLSPGFEEADIMRRVLAKDEFKKWLDAFLPNLKNPDFKLEPGIVSDRTDGHLVHLDGLNYSRAWCLFGIAETLPEYGHLVKVGNDHINHSLPDLTDGNYEGGHWLASFALLALSK
jgi:hypothetical protein